MFYFDEFLSIIMGIGVSIDAINDILAQENAFHILLGEGNGANVFDTWSSAGLRQLGSTATADMLALNAHDLRRGYMGSQFVIGHWPGSGSIGFGFGVESYLAVSGLESIGISLLFVVVALVMHRVIVKVLKNGSTEPSDHE